MFTFWSPSALQHAQPCWISINWLKFNTTVSRNAQYKNLNRDTIDKHTCNPKTNFYLKIFTFIIFCHCTLKSKKSYHHQFQDSCAFHVHRKSEPSFLSDIPLNWHIDAQIPCSICFRVISRPLVWNNSAWLFRRFLHLSGNQTCVGRKIPNQVKIRFHTVRLVLYNRYKLKINVIYFGFLPEFKMKIGLTNSSVKKNSIVSLHLCCCCF